MGPGRRLAHPAPAAPAQRGRAPLRAGRRPGHFGGRPGPLRRTARRHRRGSGVAHCSPTGGAIHHATTGRCRRSGSPPTCRTASPGWRMPRARPRAGWPKSVPGSPQDGDALTVTPPSWRPDLLQPADLVEEVLRLEGLEAIPSVLPAAPAGRGLTAGQKRRRAIGKSLAQSGLRRGAADAVPARRRVRPLGAARRRPAAPHHRCAQPAGGRPPGLGHHAAARLCWKRWGATYPAAWSTSRCSPSRRWSSRPSRRVGVELIPVDRRPTDAEIAELDASLPRQPQQVAAVLTGLREPRGPWGPGRRAKPPTPSRRCESSPAPADLTSRCARPSICRGIRADVPRCSSGIRPSATPGSCTRPSSSARACRKAPAPSS